jgi:hypothetical protein
MMAFIKRAFALLAGFIGHALAGAVIGALVFNIITLIRLLIGGLDFDLKFVLFVSAVGAFFGLGNGFAYVFRQVDATLKGRARAESRTVKSAPYEATLDRALESTGHASDGRS